MSTQDRSSVYYGLPASKYVGEAIDDGTFPKVGMPARAAYELISLGLGADGNPAQNLATFVTTWMEPEANQLIADAASTNHIDHEEYPIAERIEEICVRMLADLWHAPDIDDAVGVATIGSSEAIMLGLLAHKFTWRNRRKEQGLSTDKPNIVYGAETHIVWDKFARYFDVEPRKVPMRPDYFKLHPDDVEPLVDENTIAVGAVVGTTFIGESDPVSELNDLLVRIKAEKGWDIPLHVDGASGGFIAPFAHPDERWDFRLPQVKSINASGHKYGLVYPGVGWLLFRDRASLPSDLIFDVNYLGGAQPTFTFNFSRASSMIQAQLYLFIRLGREGYANVVKNMLANAQTLTDALVSSGRFDIYNPRLAEPVVTFSIKGDPGFDEFHLADGLRQRGWIVPAYTLPPNAEHVTVLRVVVRNDMTHNKIEILLADLDDAWNDLAGVDGTIPPSKPERKTHEKIKRQC